MDKLEIDYKFNLEDFKIIENIEHLYFPNENITKAEEVMNWYRKNDLTCIGVRNIENKIVASVNILPLKKEIFYDIYNNKMNEVDVIDTQIEKYENGKSYYIYLSSISIDKEHRNNYKVIKKLIKGCIDLFDMLKIKDIKIEKMMADASTIHGEKICIKLLKMHYIRNTSHKSKIYCVDGEEMLKTLDRIKKFTK
jgi:hypothetical protein